MYRIGELSLVTPSHTNSHVGDDSPFVIRSVGLDIQSLVFVLLADSFGPLSGCQNCSSVFVSLSLSLCWTRSLCALSLFLLSSLLLLPLHFTSFISICSVYSVVDILLCDPAPLPPPPVFHRPVAPLTVPAVVPLRSRSNVCHLLAISLAFPPTVYTSVLALFPAPLSLSLSHLFPSAAIPSTIPPPSYTPLLFPAPTRKCAYVYSSGRSSWSLALAGWICRLVFSIVSVRFCSCCCRCSL